jgi:hypothetical protein|tara:strand:+ start:1080 stop:1634 length:555 start_codon:yes stop_codon:yes gene_type:complete
MSIQIYKPNKNNSGFAFSFSMGEDRKSGEPVLYVSAIAQYAWDEKKRLGSFIENKEKPEKNLSLKFNEFECGAIISCIENRFEYNTFHKFEDNKTTIKFSPWDKNDKIQKFNPSTKKYDSSSQVVPAFGLSITKNGNATFKLPLEPGEAQCLAKFIDCILARLYSFRMKKQTNISSANSEDCPI